MTSYSSRATYALRFEAQQGIIAGHHSQRIAHSSVIFYVDMTQTSDITIIGGGIIGLLTAREFNKTGASVTLIERNQIGQESSWAGGGILLPLYPWHQPDPINRLVLQSLRLYPNLATELKAETPIDPEWNPCGLLITKNPDIIEADNWCRSNNLPHSPANDALLAPFVTQPVNPLWLPDIANARNPRLVKSLKADLINRGVHLIEQTALKSVAIDGSTITSIETTSGKQAVNHLIIATGAWTGDVFAQFFGGLNVTPPKIFPVKGQMLVFDAPPQCLPYIVLDGDQYLIPRLDGKILAGSTVEHDDYNKATSPEVNAQLREFAIRLFPKLKNCPVIHHWAGLRPGTDHGIPYIDRHPEITNLSINAGHFRYGLVMGPASAQLMVDLILERTPSVSPEPYRMNADH
jgi:glycine oxidase